MPHGLLNLETLPPLLSYLASPRNTGMITWKRPKQGVKLNVIRLPHLNMPTFLGDPLLWELFWDSFDAAVHSSPSLSTVQKLTYLRSQLHGSAAKVISGLSLTSSNYEHSNSSSQGQIWATT